MTQIPDIPGHRRVDFWPLELGEGGQTVWLLPDHPNGHNLGLGMANGEEETDEQG